MFFVRTANPVAIIRTTAASTRLQFTTRGAVLTFFAPTREDAVQSLPRFYDWISLVCFLVFPFFTTFVSIDDEKSLVKE